MQSEWDSRQYSFWFKSFQESRIAYLDYLPCNVDVEEVGEAEDDANVWLFGVLLQIRRLPVLFRLLVPP